MSAPRRRRRLSLQCVCFLKVISLDIACAFYFCPLFGADLDPHLLTSSPFFLFGRYNKHKNKTLVPFLLHLLHPSHRTSSTPLLPLLLFFPPLAPPLLLLLLRCRCSSSSSTPTTLLKYKSRMTEGKPDFSQPKIPTVPTSNIPDFQSVLKTHVLGIDLFHSQFKWKDCRGLVHLFYYRCLQIWFADYRRFTS
ncbi:hypothetical protein Hanom_Chr01g00003871 [Helianthus anomalus]